MPVIYDSKKIIPAPFISISNEVDRRANSQKRKDVFTITVRGTIIAHMGSPNSSGTFHTGSGYPAGETIAMDSRQAAIQAKIGALVNLFNTENKWFEVEPWDGSPPIKFLARKKSIVFDEGIWVERCNYTITLEAECIYFGGIEVCAYGSADDLVDESWDIEPTDETMRVYRLSHTVSAQFPDGRNTDGTISTKGSQRAKSAVQAKLGLNGARLEQSGVLNLDKYQAYNHTRQVNENDSDGSYRVVETWLCFAPGNGHDAIPAIEDYTVTIREQNGVLSSSINGQIKGLFSRNNNFDITTAALTNANAKWAGIQGSIFTRAQAATEIPLNPIALSRQKVTDYQQGIISYDYQYDTRPNFGIAGAIGVSVTVQDINPADVFASIPIINRIRGPILQSIGTVTERRRTISVEVITGPVGYGALYPPIKPDVSGIIAYYAPAGFAQVFKAEDNENTQLTEGRYSRTVSYVVQ